MLRQIKQGQVKGIDPDIDMQVVLLELAKCIELNRNYKSYNFKGMVERTQIQKWHSAVEIRGQTGRRSQLVYVRVCASMNNHFCRYDYEGCFLNFASINQSVFCKYTAQSVYAIKCVCWLSSFWFPFLGSAPQSRNAFIFHCSFNLWTPSYVCLQLVHKSWLQLPVN